MGLGFCLCNKSYNKHRYPCLSTHAPNFSLKLVVSSLTKSSISLFFEFAISSITNITYITKFKFALQTQTHGKPFLFPRMNDFDSPQSITVYSLYSFCTTRTHCSHDFHQQEEQCLPTMLHPPQTYDEELWDFKI